MLHSFCGGRFATRTRGKSGKKGAYGTKRKKSSTPPKGPRRLCSFINDQSAAEKHKLGAYTILRAATKTLEYQALFKLLMVTVFPGLGEWIN